MCYTKVSGAGTVAMPVINHLGKSQWARASGVHKKCDRLDNWLECVEELLRGTGVNLKGHIAIVLPGGTEKGDSGGFRHFREEREGWGLGCNTLDEGITDAGGAKVLRHKRGNHHLDFGVSGQGKETLPSVVDDVA